MAIHDHKLTEEAAQALLAKHWSFSPVNEAKARKREPKARINVSAPAIEEGLRVNPGRLTHPTRVGVGTVIRQ